MTINQIIDLLDAQKPNAYSDAVKREWLNQIDGMAFREVIATHEGGIDGFDGYGPETDGETELLLDDDFKNVYVYWMYAMIDFANQELTRYTNSMIMFNNEYGTWSAWYNRTHMPRTAHIKGAGARVIR